MIAYKTLKDSTVRPDVKAGTTVYIARVPDWGVSSGDTRTFGYECVSVTLDPNGGYPLFSMPRHDLQTVVMEEKPAVDTTNRPSEQTSAIMDYVRRVPGVLCSNYELLLIIDAVLSYKPDIGLADNGIPLHGGEAMRQGWTIDSNPYRRAACNRKRRDHTPLDAVREKEWRAEWLTEEARCFRSHVFGTDADPTGLTGGKW